MKIYFSQLLLILKPIKIWIKNKLKFFNFKKQCCDIEATGGRKCKCTGKGETGDNGLPGQRGPAGKHGAIGSRGPKGPRGSKGEEGEVGPTGSRGTKVKHQIFEKI